MATDPLTVPGVSHISLQNNMDHIILSETVLKAARAACVHNSISIDIIWMFEGRNSK